MSATLFHRKIAPPPHLLVLIHHAVDATLLHRLRVVNMLRFKGPVLHKQHPDEEKSHADSNY